MNDVYLEFPFCYEEEELPEGVCRNFVPGYYNLSNKSKIYIVRVDTTKEGWEEDARKKNLIRKGDKFKSIYANCDWGKFN